MSEEHTSALPTSRIFPPIQPDKPKKKREPKPKASKTVADVASIEEASQSNLSIQPDEAIEPEVLEPQVVMETGISKGLAEMPVAVNKSGAIHRFQTGNKFGRGGGKGPILWRKMAAFRLEAIRSASPRRVKRIMDALYEAATGDYEYTIATDEGKLVVVKGKRDVSAAKLWLEYVAGRPKSVDEAQGGTQNQFVFVFDSSGRVIDHASNSGD